jgi:hypothetical protein
MNLRGAQPENALYIVPTLLQKRVILLQSPSSNYISILYSLARPPRFEYEFKRSMSLAGRAF